MSTKMKNTSRFNSVGFVFNRSRFQHHASLPLPERSKPLLMLEGDCFHLGPDGVGRTAYVDHLSGLLLEEQYHIESARKIFMLRKFQGHDKYSKRGKIAKKIQVGPSIFGCKLQEIDFKHIFEGSGTGVTTWEASIAMSFYFLNNPEELKGKVIEVGSGVGLGGMLTLRAAAQHRDQLKFQLESFTFTDGSNHVVNQCVENLKEAPDIKGFVKVKRLDWNYPISSADAQSYSTIIASDVIYLHSDIEPLAATLNDLLHPSGTFHLFAPVHRSTIHHMMDELRDKYGFIVNKEIVDFSRFRLIPYNTNGKFSERFFLRQTSTESNESCPYVSEELSQFIHIQFHRGNDQRDISLMSLD